MARDLHAGSRKHADPTSASLHVIEVRTDERTTGGRYENATNGDTGDRGVLTSVMHIHTNKVNEEGEKIG